MRKFLAFVVCLCMVMAMAVTPALADGATPGVYTETVKGMSDGMVVEVTIGEQGIEKIEILEHNETPPGYPAIELLPKQIIDAQSIAVDSIAGATMSSGGIKEAVRLALVEAGADVEAFSVAPDAKEEVAPSYYPVMGSFEVPETWDESYEIVVVGGGYAGMAAAYSASTNGAKTTLVEKLATTGGNSSINGGQYAAYTSQLAAGLQEKFNLQPDTPEDHIKDTMIGGDLMSKEALVKNMVYASPFYLDLLLDNGLIVRDTLARPGGHYQFRMYVTENQVGSDITEVQKKMLEKTDVVVQTNTKMVEIYRSRDEANRVLGIRVATPEGYKTIEATKGVLLATGGFGANVAMRETQVPYLNEEIPTTNNVAVSTGEGIYLAQAIGANTMQMSNIQRYPFADPTNGVLDKYAVWPFTGPSYGVIYVDYTGARYVNEGERRDVTANAAADSGFPSTYCVFTEEVVGFTTPEEIAEGVKTGRVLMGNTVEELAEKINALEIKGQKPSVDAQVLKDAIERHNGFIDSGVDEEFGKVMTNTMIKMENGPYYAVAQYPSVHHTMGGLVIDEYTQVYDIYGQVIEGLYAAGEVTGGVHGTNRLGSNADADACGMGYISGYYVATNKLPDFIPEG